MTQSLLEFEISVFAIFTKSLIFYLEFNLAALINPLKSGCAFIGSDVIQDETDSQ